MPTQAGVPVQIDEGTRKLLRTEGVRGLYKGLAPALIKAAPNAAITFWCFEWASAQLAERFSEESK